MTATFRRHWYLLIPLALMLVIFLFSASPATQSTATSRPIAEFFGIPEVIIRKTAHFTIYALLGASWYFYLRRLSIFTPAFTILASLLLALLYAVTDEFHQTFVPGRSGLLSDILIDTAGASVGIILCATIYYLALSPAQRRSRRHQIRHIWNANNQLISARRRPKRS